MTPNHSTDRVIGRLKKKKILQLPLAIKGTFFCPVGQGVELPVREMGKLAVCGCGIRLGKVRLA